MLSASPAGSSSTTDASTNPTGWSSSITCGFPSSSRTSLPVEHENAVDPAQRKGIWLAGNLNQESTDHRDGDRQLEHESGSLTGPCIDPDKAADCSHHVVNHVEPDTAAGDFGYVFLGREPRKEQEFEQFRLAELRGDRRRGQLTLDDLGSQPFQVDSATIVTQNDLEHPRPMASFEPDGARLPSCRRPGAPQASRGHDPEHCE